jgi:hypothetical protein
MWGRRGGPWKEIVSEGTTKKGRPKINPLQRLPTLGGPLGDPRDRVATPPDW